MIKITHNADDNIVWILKEGSFDFDDSIALLKRLDEEYDGVETLYILEDSRETRYKIGFSEIPKLLQEVKKRMGGRKEVRHADIVETPLETAISIVFAKFALRITNYTYRAFSTEQAAIAWIKKGTYYNK